MLRNKLVLIGLVCAAPMVLGTLAYVLHLDTGARGNYGELVTPRPLTVPALAALKGKWVFVTFDDAACGAACEKKLYIVRQVRRAQGKEMDRIERLWMITGGGSPRAELLQAIEGSQIARADRAFEASFPGRPAEDIYLVDPLGNLMLRFPADPDPSRVIKDLQRLLRYSRFG